MSEIRADTIGCSCYRLRAAQRRPSVASSADMNERRWIASPNLDVKLGCFLFSCRCDSSGSPVVVLQQAAEAAPLSTCVLRLISLSAALEAEICQHSGDEHVLFQLS